jgi:ligand-binding sensor protein
VSAAAPGFRVTIVTAFTVKTRYEDIREAFTNINKCNLLTSEDKFNERFTDDIKVGKKGYMASNSRAGQPFIFKSIQCQTSNQILSLQQSNLWRECVNKCRADIIGA